jgi:group I intron endonuclease
MHYLYRITDLLNNKIYIGQAVNPNRRWVDHKWNSKQSEPIQYISRAMAKYGIENFIFEVISTCRTQEDTNEVEAILIEQYNSRDKQFGYNIKPGGNNAPHAEETKEKQRQATIKQIAEKGHPAAGRIVTQETRDLMRKIRLENPIEYTEETRQRMSDAHIGHTQSEETIIKRMESIQKILDNRDYSDIKCYAPGCNVSGKNKYIILNSIRYCLIHGQRLRRTGFLELQPRSSHNKGKKTSEEVLLKLRGRVAPNRHHFEPDQIYYILNCGKSMKALSRELGVTEKVIKRIRDGKY